MSGPRTPPSGRRPGATASVRLTRARAIKALAQALLEAPDDPDALKRVVVKVRLSDAGAAAYDVRETLINVNAMRREAAAIRAALAGEELGDRDRAALQARGDAISGELAILRQ